MKTRCKGNGTLEYIDGKWWCIGEKIVSTWKHSKLNKTNKDKKRRNISQAKSRTRKQRRNPKN